MTPHSDQFMTRISLYTVWIWGRSAYRFIGMKWIEVVGRHKLARWSLIISRGVDRYVTEFFREQ